MTHGVRTWGNDPHGSTIFLVGAYEHLSDISGRLLRALPPVLLLSKADWDSPLVGLLEAEVVNPHYSWGGEHIAQRFVFTGNFVLALNTY